MTEIPFNRGLCEVCGQEDAVSVAAVPGVPMSLAYGSKCLSSGLAYPLWLLVANTSIVGGMEHAADWWREEVEHCLPLLGVSREEFDRQVKEAIKQEEDDLKMRSGTL